MSRAMFSCHNSRADTTDIRSSDPRDAAQYPSVHRLGTTVRTYLAHHVRK